MSAHILRYAITCSGSVKMIVESLNVRYGHFIVLIILIALLQNSIRAYFAIEGQHQKIAL